MLGMVGFRCPVCGTDPIFIFDHGKQCWCGNAECPVITWDAYRTLNELLDGVHFLQLPGDES